MPLNLHLNISPDIRSTPRYVHEVTHSIKSPRCQDIAAPVICGLLGERIYSFGTKGSRVGRAGHLNVVDRVALIRFKTHVG